MFHDTKIMQGLLKAFNFSVVVHENSRYLPHSLSRKIVCFLQSPLARRQWYFEVDSWYEQKNLLAKNLISTSAPAAWAYYLVNEYLCMIDC